MTPLLSATKQDGFPRNLAQAAWLESVRDVMTAVKVSSSGRYFSRLKFVSGFFECLQQDSSVHRCGVGLVMRHLWNVMGARF